MTVRDRKMSVAKQSSKTHDERLVGIEEQMLYLVEVPDSIRFLEQRLEDIAKKADGIEAVSDRLDGLPIQELLTRVDTLESRVMKREMSPRSLGTVHRALLPRWKNELWSLITRKRTCWR